MQLEEEIYMNSRSRNKGRTMLRRCGNCNKPRYNARIYKKDEEMSNVYSSGWFQLIFGVVVDLFEKEGKHVRKSGRFVCLADLLIIHVTILKTRF